MNANGNQENGLVQEMRRCRPARPSDRLKQRVLGAATAAWEHPDADPETVPWRIVLGPLLAAAAALAVVLASAEFANRRLLPPGVSRGEARTVVPPQADVTYASLNGNPFIERLAAMAARHETGSGLKEYRRRLDAALDLDLLPEADGLKGGNG